MNTVLKRNDAQSGLCSFFWVMIDMVVTEIQNNNRPYVDMRTVYNSQFHDHSSVNKINVWDLFFEQPFCSYDELPTANQRIFRHHNLIQRDQTNADLIDQYIRPRKDLVKLAEDFIQQHLSNNTVGVLIRRTDYTVKRPRGHHVQPDISDVIKDIESLIERYGVDKIFVATESEQCVLELIKTFGDIGVETYQKHRCHCVNEFIYDAMDRLSFEQKKQINIEYFVSILIMIRLQYLLLGRTSATEIYSLLRKDSAKYQKIYDLGTY